jgi:hypothetical protein
MHRRDRSRHRQTAEIARRETAGCRRDGEAARRDRRTHQGRARRRSVRGRDRPVRAHPPPGALDAALAKPHRISATLIAAIEGATRESGAEEVIIDVAPDLARGTRLLRIEGEVALAHYAVRVSAAYKGHWVRVTRSSDGGAEIPLAGVAAGAALPQNCTAEVTIGSAPLSPVAKLPAGSVASLTFTLAGPTLAGAPVLVPDKGPATPL